MKPAIPLILVAVLPTFAHAQDRNGTPDRATWQISAHGSWTAAGAPPHGSGSLDSSAPLIPLALVVPEQTSRVSSWFFGAGAALMRVTKADELTRHSAQSLDATLTGAASGPQSGAGFGVSVTRRLRGRTSLEVAVDRSRTGTGFSRSARDAIASARSSYERFFQTMTGLFDEDTGTAHVTAAGVDSRPSEWQVTGALRIDLRAGRRRPLYLTAGGGLVQSEGDAARVTLVNEYSFNPVNFRSGLRNAFDEIDRLVLHARGPRHRGVVTLGGATSRNLTARTGIELDVRASVSRPSVAVTVDASPHVALVANDPDLLQSGITGLTGASTTFPVTDPVTVILFNSNQDLFPAYPSSLSGPPLSGLQTFSGRGLQVNATFRVGIYYRF